MIEVAGIEVAVEDDPPPVVRAIANDLAACLEDPEFAELTQRARGAVCLRSADTPQSVTALVGDGGVALAHGRGSEVDVAATTQIGDAAADPALEGADRNPDLAAWARRLLAPPMPPVERAAERFWGELSGLQRSPRALVVVDVEAGARHRFGPDDGPACELHGPPDGLLAVLTGRASAMEAAYDGTVQVRCSFPDLSVLSGAGFRIRYGETDRDG